jgi:hypothetical protein
MRPTCPSPPFSILNPNLFSLLSFLTSFYTSNPTLFIFIFFCHLLSRGEGWGRPWSFPLLDQSWCLRAQGLGATSLTLVPTISRTGGYEPDPCAYELKGVLISSVGCSRKSQKAVYYALFFYFFMFGVQVMKVYWLCGLGRAVLWLCGLGSAVLTHCPSWLLFLGFGAW